MPAFLQSPFWVGTTEATLSTIGSSDEPLSGTGRDAIQIATQTSSNAREVGIIRAWLSCEPNGDEGLGTKMNNTNCTSGPSSSLST